MVTGMGYMKNLSNMLEVHARMSRCEHLPESIAEFIGKNAVSIGVEGHEYVRRCHKKQRNEVVVAQCCGQGREIVLETTRTNNTHLAQY